MNPPRLSIVIRCFNEEEHIGRLLSGIVQQNIKDIEIVVVDSGSTDATVSIASQYPTKIFHIKPEEFSFGYSLNVGCEAASGDFIVIVSAHVYPVYKDWIEHLLTPFSDQQVALVYGKQRGNEGTKYSEHHVFAKWFPNDFKPSQNYPFCNNANAAIRKSVWEKMPYDETLTGLEDIDWARKIMESGYRIVYNPDAEIIHVHHERFLQTYNRYKREAIAMKRIFPHERFTLYNFIRLWTGNVISDLRHAKYDRKLSIIIFISIMKFRLAQFWGTYRGYKHPGSVTDHLRKRFYYPKGFVKVEQNYKEAKSDRKIDYTGHRP